jgi:alkaline phosphatase
MIDIKENSEAVITQLVKLLSPYRDVFDRTVNPKAVQVVLSGERGTVQQWTQWPSYILFDGRPDEIYDSATLQRLAFISDSYMNYANNKDSIESRLQRLVKKVHGMGKLLRLWATPDNPSAWAKLNQSGVDIINTDKVSECQNYFLSKHK